MCINLHTKKKQNLTKSDQLIERNLLKKSNRKVNSVVDDKHSNFHKKLLFKNRKTGWNNRDKTIKNNRRKKRTFTLPK